MNILIELFRGADWLPLLAEFAVKATVILTLTAAAAGLMWRCSAAVRHMVWTVGIASMLTLPLLSGLLPEWELPVLPGPDAAVSATVYAAELHWLASIIVQSCEVIFAEAAPPANGYYIKVAPGHR